MKCRSFLVGNYTMIARNGYPIRKATWVQRIDTGEVVRFTEELGKRKAIKQAVYYFEGRESR